MSGDLVITGPVGGGQHGWAFGASAVDVAEAGYVEEEYLIAGDATRYRLAPSATYQFDGVWSAEPAGSAPFTTRVIVRKPRDASRFNGTVLVSWNNVSAGYENVTELTPEVIEGGFVQLCVSAQQVGVHGFPFPEPKGLVTWDAERYGQLSIPDDGLSYDIFTQAGMASERLSGLGGKRVAAGASQSAMRLATYVNAVQPLTNAFDAFILDVYSGAPTVLDPSDPLPARRDYMGPMTEIIGAIAEQYQLRADLAVPILVVNSETEANDYFSVRQPDTDRYRFWEVAGAAHASSDKWELAEARALRDFGGVSPSPFVPPENRNTIALDPVREAAMHQMHIWVHGGPPPPSQPPIEFDGDPAAIVRDNYGNAVGGLRLPDMEVPIASHMGERAHPVDLFGSSNPFPVETVKELYGDAATYRARYNKAVTAAVEAGVVMPRDAERLRERAAARGALFS